MEKLTTDTETGIIKGLSQKQVQELTDAGKVNGEQDIRTKSYGRIIRDNLFTLFNLVNVINYHLTSFIF